MEFDDLSLTGTTHYFKVWTDMDKAGKCLERLCQIIELEEFMHKVSIPLQVECDPTLIVLTLWLFKTPCQKNQISYQKYFSMPDLRL